MNQHPAMEDITPLMMQYRECARHLWNTYFWQVVSPGDDDPDCDLADKFDDICVNLFSAMVLYRLDLDHVQLTPTYRYPDTALDFLQIKLPAMPPADRSIVLVNREKDSGYWDLDVTEEELMATTVSFVNFFDFDHYGFRNLTYYKGQIQSSTVRADLRGRLVLVPVEYGKVYFTGNDKAVKSP